MSAGEERFLRALLDGAPCSLPLGPGDDAALLPGGLLAALDSVVQGVHFEAHEAREDVAHKAFAVNVSDFAAMGAVPRWALVAAQIPRGEDLPRLAAAVRAAAAAFGLELAGGDTVAAPPGALALAVTLLGPAPAGAPWTRSGGRPGDRLWVSGPLGGSRAGRHLRPRPRTDLALRLRAEGVEVHAAMDLSDGLAADLPRLCAASGCGAVVRAEALPVHADVAPGRDPVAAALGDGEDFELLLALPPALAPHGLVEIGMLEASGPPVLERDGRREPWPAGYAHDL